jgi:hypothetical protein
MCEEVKMFFTKELKMLDISRERILIVLTLEG